MKCSLIIKTDIMGYNKKNYKITSTGLVKLKLSGRGIPQVLLPTTTQRLCVESFPHYFYHDFRTKFPEGWVYVVTIFYQTYRHVAFYFLSKCWTQFDWVSHIYDLIDDATKSRTLLYLCWYIDCDVMIMFVRLLCYSYHDIPLFIKTVYV